ncbi:MAG TPA: hypothetical protein ENK18_15330 [Deltaproteobacteria bacterium]|nr:hypothetical protein [Deltaproteobacteria bacterium]
MSDPLQMWSDRLADAQTDEDRRALLAELALWRVKNLTDITATRRATYTVALLYQRLGERERAVGEARSLVSLCRTPPEAAEEEIISVNRLMRSLDLPPLSAPPRPTGGAASSRRERPPRERKGKPARELSRQEARRGAIEEARQAVASEDWSRALRALEGQRGAPALVIRAYVELSLALAAPEDQRAAKLEAVRGLLARGSGIRAQGERAAEEDTPLTRLLGSVPARRAAQLRAIDAFAEAHPDRLDELAEAALLHHVQIHGKTAPAPWLVGTVGRALASGDAERTQAAINALRSERSIAVQAYDEWPFERLLRVMSRALAEGMELRGLRRGVLAREEPDDRKLWTLRLGIDGVERMICVGPHATVPYPPGKAGALAVRLVALCPRTLLLATGSGNEELRAQAEARGLSVQAHDADDEALLALLRGARGRGGGAAAPPPERLAEALQAEVFDVDAVREAVSDFRRPDRALRPVLRLELDDERTAGLLTAVHAAAEPGIAIPEGTTLAIRVAAHGGATRAILVDGPAAERFGGPGVSVVVELARAMIDDGWVLHRVLRGPTRRECRLHPAVETLSGSMGGLWRLLIRKGDQRGEVWFVADLPAEGRAAVPLLLLEEHARVVVLPAGSDLVSWWASISGAPEPIGWSGAEAPLILQAAAAFPAVPLKARGAGESGVAPTPG